MTNKTFTLLIEEDHDFFCVDDKVVTIETVNHQLAMDYFIDNFGKVLLGLTIMTFCFDDEMKKYGYEYVTLAK